MSTTTITITIDHATGAVTTRTGGNAARAPSAPRSTGGGGDAWMPGRGTGKVRDADDAALADARKWVGDGLDRNPDGPYADRNRTQLAAIDAEIALRGGAVSEPGGDFGGDAGAGDAGADDDQIPF